MKAALPGVAARQGGGFRQGFGHFDEEHLEQNAAASAVGQKQLTQQTTQNAQHSAGGSATQPGDSSRTPAQQSSPPREVSTVKDELIKRPVQDVKKGLTGIFDLHALLNINPEDTPEEQQRKKALNERFGKLTEDQQAVARKKFEAKMVKEKAEEEEKEKKKRELELKEQQDIAPPSSPRKGPIGPGGPGGGTLSRKKLATQMLERDRQSIGRVAGAN
ncbi:MAG: Kelch motif family protein [Candidatus Pacebacteria bacterium GW2011_GWA1_46_10]|nr:MAG: Kelch motif family protein [Candidatus Pacebacteria bacterium GW2011_GWA1_46_10]HCR81287.1 hypothetical protein [Candidatus Paceibacterota bacterium]